MTPVTLEVSERFTNFGSEHEACLLGRLPLGQPEVHFANSSLGRPVVQSENTNDVEVSVDDEPYSSLTILKKALEVECLATANFKRIHVASLWVGQVASRTHEPANLQEYLGFVNLLKDVRF